MRGASSGTEASEEGPPCREGVRARRQALSDKDPVADALAGVPPFAGYGKGVCFPPDIVELVEVALGVLDEVKVAWQGPGQAGAVRAATD